MRTRRYIQVLGAAVAVGVLLRIVVTAQLAASDPTFDQPLLDGRIFLDWAARIAAGEPSSAGPFFFNPLYAWFLAPVVAIAGDHALAAVRVLQALLGIGTVLLLASATRRLLGRREAAVAAVLASAWPALLHFEGIAIGATLGVFVNTLALDLLARWRTRPTRGRLLGAGAVIGVAVLGRPNVILLPAALPPWMRRCLPARGGGWVAAVGILLLGTLLPLLPSLARNLAVSGEPVLTTTSMGVNLHLTNNALAWDTGRMDSRVLPLNPFLLEGASRATAEAAEGRRLSATEASSFWTRHALRECREDPGRAALFLLRKSLYFCGSHELPSSDSFAQARRDSSLLALLSLPLAFGLLLPLAVLGSVAVLRRRRRALPLVILLAVYAFGLVIFFPLSHYRLPVLPALLPLSAAGLVDLLDALRGRRGAGTGWRWGVVAAAALLSHGNLIAGAVGARDLGPYPEPASWMLANRAQVLVGKAAVGKAAEREATLARAERQATLALAAAPAGDNARWLVFAAFARIARARGEWEEEARRLAEALDLSPGQPQVLADLALNLLRRGRTEEARRVAGEARAAGASLDPETRALLGF